MNLGLSGRLTRATIRSPLTPLFLLAAIALGLIALLVIPREEEPQISVPMVDIRINTDGLKAPDAVELVTKPLEAIVKAIDGVEHIYSQSEDDRVMVTARFLVGTKAEDAILRVHEKIRANMDRIPVGIPEPLIVGRGIDDGGSEQTIRKARHQADVATPAITRRAEPAHQANGHQGVEMMRQEIGRDTEAVLELGWRAIGKCKRFRDGQTGRIAKRRENTGPPLKIRNLRCIAH